MAKGATIVDQLVELGFSSYEARAYVGLLGKQPMTGYALANLTGIPQPKVYETLRRLARKGVATALEGEPLRFVAVPPDKVLAEIDSTFHRRLADAESGLERERDGVDQQLRVFEAYSKWGPVELKAAELLDSALRHVYVSMNCEAPILLESVAAADARGVEVDLLCFGRDGLSLEHGRSLRHATTDGVVYRHHQARHLAVVADSTRALWALAPSGEDWQAVLGDDVLLAAAVKGYIRHDMYVQQISRDFGQLLEAHYGPALEELVVPGRSSAPPDAERAGERKPVPTRRQRGTRSA